MKREGDGLFDAGSPAVTLSQRGYRHRTIGHCSAFWHFSDGFGKCVMEAEFEGSSYGFKMTKESKKRLAAALFWARSFLSPPVKA